MSAVRILFAAAAAALLAVGLYAGWALFPGSLGPPSIRAVDPAAEAERAERLAAEQEAIAHCIATREQIHQGLAEGRLSLPRAVALLREEDAGRRPPVRHLRVDLFPGRDDEERWCHAAIEYVQNLMADDPRRDATLARLRAELKDHLTARAGTPPPGATARAD